MTLAASETSCAHTGLRCLVAVAQQSGINVSVDQMKHDFVVENQEVGLSQLMRMARKIGLKARTVAMSWQHLFRLGQAFPAIVQLRNGNSMLVIGHSKVGETPLIVLRDPLATTDDGILALDERRFAEAWDGQVLLLKRDYAITETTQPFGFRWFLAEILRHRRLYLDIGIAALLLSVLTMAMPVFIQLILDRVVVHNSLGTLYVLASGLGLVILFETIFSYLRQYTVMFATRKIDARINVATYNKLISLPMDFFEKTPAGMTMKNLSQSERIRNFMTGPVFGAMLDSVALIFLVPMMFLYQPVLAMIVMGFTLAICVVVGCVIPLLKHRFTKVYEAETRMNSMLIESIHGMRTIKSLALDSRQRKEWDHRVAYTARVRFDVQKLALIAQSLVGPLEKLMTATVIAVGAYLVLQREMQIGGLIAFHIISGRVVGPLVQMSSLLQQFQEVSLSIRMLGTIMNHPSEDNRSGRGLRIPFKGLVEFSNVRFRYAPSAPAALDNVSFCIPEGTIFGIMGRSGSGKTTITRLLQGLHSPQEGLIKIDGSDLREIALDHLRTSIGVVLQENFLFRGTIRENIAAAKPSATLEEVMRAARLAGADEFIERLPKGFETVLEEGSANLSGGQRQRLAIARALLTDPRILILDEATSALDAESEAIVQANLMSIARGRTVIIISHRLSTLVPADNIMVLERGQVNDIGRHDELLQRCEIYQHLWHQQNRHI